ncbi:unnamed protein product [Protopolystoma xenopodis]|uniref:Uncharacterized protein n=1 Tax=Protopolystoma xenopodis TaxID=117903 RepID=A0A448XCX6_9PLAT|nr:unnamed protein product [Protopolystoma xenopodis]
MQGHGYSIKLLRRDVLLARRICPMWVWPMPSGCRGTLLPIAMSTALGGPVEIAKTPSAVPRGNRISEFILDLHFVMNFFPPLFLTFLILPAILTPISFPPPVLTSRKLYSSELGPKVEHVFLVENRGGPDLTNLKFWLDIPVATSDGDYLVYLADRVRKVVVGGKDLSYREIDLRPICKIDRRREDTVSTSEREQSYFCGDPVYLALVQLMFAKLNRVNSKALIVYEAGSSFNCCAHFFLTQLLWGLLSFDADIDWAASSFGVFTADGHVRGQCVLPDEWNNPLQLMILDLDANKGENCQLFCPVLPQMSDSATYPLKD